LEGDWDLTGDYCEIQRTNGTWLTMSSALRQTNNFFHSIIGIDGAQFLNRVPASQNTLGFDADKFPIPNAGNAVIGNNQTSATIRMGTSQEIYGLFLAGLSVDVWYPSLLAMFTIPAMPGGSGGVLNAGDTASFLISVRNTGNDDATGVTLQSQLPPALEFLGLEPPLNPGVSWQYDTLTQILQFSVADSLAAAGRPPFQIRYRTRVSSDCNLADTSFLHPVCQLSLGYHGAINPALFTATGSTAVNSCGIGNQAPVTFSIVPPLFPPVARDDTASTPEDTPVTIPILANDYDCNNNLNINSIWVITPPLHGTFQTQFNTGWIIYTPILNYYGPDTLMYRVCDEDGQCDTARVAIAVLPVNDPPSVQNEEYVACINVKVEGNLLANDADTVENTALAVMLPPLSGPNHGTLLMGVSGNFEYTPFSGFTGSDTIIVSVCDCGFPMPPMCLNDTVILHITLPVSANAGPDIEVCGDTAVVLSGNDPSPGIGTWSQILGPSPASLLPLSDSSVLARGLIPGDYRFLYTIAAGECLSADTLDLHIIPPLSQAEAGPDQFLCLENPDTTGTLLAGNTPATGTGHWSQAAGPTLASLLSPGEPATRVSALAEGEYRFVWTVTNGICDPVSDTVAIRVSRRAIVKAGHDLTLCPG
ncbi:MAG TPA: Ig-like domain-containing protein, partial [Bacteroidales bacterium]|nr:Ig-like domain-containing protein [Bacteroidales bacterium]